MPAALTPAQGLGYLRELSADLTAAVILDNGGELLAGPPTLHDPARKLLAHTDGTEVHGRTSTGSVFAARDGRHQIVVTTGPLALPRLARHDLRAALAALSDGAPIPETTPKQPSRQLVEALMTAVRSPH